MGSSKQPEAPDPAKTYEKGVQTDIKYLPQQLDAEAEARSQQNDEYARQWLALQQQYGSDIADVYLNLLSQIDPQGVAIRQKMGDMVSADLDAGYSLGPDLQRQTEQDIRGAQAARGNILGNSAASAESLYKGQRGIDLYNQRLANAGRFLTTASPQSQIGIPTVMGTINPGFQYINRNAGQQGITWGQQAYGNALGAASNQANPWAGAAAGAVAGAETGAQLGGSSYGAYGAAAGAVLGAAGGYYAS